MNLHTIIPIPFPTPSLGSGGTLLSEWSLTDPGEESPLGKEYPPGADPGGGTQDSLLVSKGLELLPFGCHFQKIT